MRRSLIAVLVAAGLVAGCGQEEASIPVDRDAEAVTSPDTGIPYEVGGADGSGADGNSGDDDPAPRGGIAAGPDASNERK